MEIDGLNIDAFEVKHLPIMSAFAQKLGLVEEIDKRIKGEMETSPGRIVLAMVLDALSGRSPLFRLSDFFNNKDTELLLGEHIEARKLSDWTIGRVLDRLYEHGTNKILTALSVRACKEAKIQDSYFHFDTTSIRVWGDFDPRHDDPFSLTRGYSKDKRPDLRQFIVSMLSVKGGLPIRYSCEDGNKSDNRTSNDVLTMISSFLSDNQFPGLSAFIADSAMVTPDNMQHLHDIPFISRLPAQYGEQSRVIKKAVSSGEMDDIGTCAENTKSERRPPAYYKAYDTSVTLYDKKYRAIVYHSSAHDARRHKKLKRDMERDKQEVSARCLSLNKKEFYCKPDAQKAASLLKPGRFHTVSTTIKERPVYGRGRPPKNGKRTPVSYRYHVDTMIAQKEEAVNVREMEAGCFVLLAHRVKELSPKEILRAYKDQESIEQNFKFLKDPMILDSLYIKTPQRIEALGLVLVVSLLIWRLLQFRLRSSIKEHGDTVEGWKGRPTEKPTSFMMTTKFSNITIVVVNNARYLNDKLTPAQQGYLKHLGLTENIFKQFPGRDPP